MICKRQVTEVNSGQFNCPDYDYVPCTPYANTTYEIFNIPPIYTGVGVGSSFTNGCQATSDAIYAAEQNTVFSECRYRVVVTVQTVCPSGSLNESAVVSGIGESSDICQAYAMAYSGASGFISGACNGLVAPFIYQQPSSLDLSLGEDATFSVRASGTHPLSYQWFFDGSQITGATSQNYTVSGIVSGNAGYYYAVVTNEGGYAISNNAYLVVKNEPPFFIQQPESLILDVGNTAIFSVLVGSDSEVTYQWYKNGGLIYGEVNSTLEIDNVQLSDGGSFTVVVTNPYGIATSSAASLAVSAPPRILIQPLDRTVQVGDTGTFIVVAVGESPLVYQWYKGATPISGANTSALQIVNAQNSDAGVYHVTITNIYGTITSRVCVLSVGYDTTAPTITISLPSASGSYNTHSSPITIAGSAFDNIGVSQVTWTNDLGDSGIASGTVNWSFTNPVLHNSVYTVTAHDAAGNTASAAISVTLNSTLPVINILIPTSTRPYTFSTAVSPITISGNSSSVNPLYLAYVNNRGGNGTVGPAGVNPWSFDVTLFSGDNAITFILLDSAYNMTSEKIIVTLTVPPVCTSPTITTQPVGTNTTAGSSVTFTVVASGSATLVYQWIKDGVFITGANSASYHIASVGTSDAGFYTCKVSNSCGTVTSSIALLTVCSPPTIGTQPQSQAAAAGSSPFFQVVASGASNYQWKFNNVAISGAVSSVLSLPHVSAGNAGNYKVDISNSCGLITSDTVTLTIT